MMKSRAETLQQPEYRKPRIAFRPDIEGIRAIAVLLVVGFHVGLPALQGGYIGVDVFFVLSGYLVTKLALSEAQENGRISLLEFYARRARRLLPAALTLLAFVLVSSAIVFSPLEQSRALSATAISAAAYSSNLYFAYAATDYSGPDGEANPLLHTWSLSVEEQFYLVWPVLLVLAYWRSTAVQSRLRILLFAIFGASLLGSVLVTRQVQPWAFFLSPMRAWEFAIGAAAAVFPSSMSARSAAAMGWLGLACIVVSAIAFDRTTPFPGYSALLPCCGTAALLYAGESSLAVPSSPGRLLASGPLTSLGALSYSFYLWHWPFVVISRAIWPDGGPLGASAAALASLVPALLSYRLVERPIRTSRVLQLNPRLSVVGGLMLSAFMVLAALGWRSWAAGQARGPEQRQFLDARSRTPGRAKGCVADFLVAEPKLCRLHGGARSQVWLIGDSHAQHWVPALERAAASLGWNVTIALKSACPVAEVEPVLANLGRRYHECSSWRKRILHTISAENPSLVIMASSNWSVDRATSITETDWARGLEATFKVLRDARVPGIYIADTPAAGFDVPACLSRNLWRSAWLEPRTCSFPIARGLHHAAADAVHEAIMATPWVQLIDINAAICPNAHCGAQTPEGTIVFRDSNHLSAAMTESLTEHLLSMLPHLAASPRNAQ